MWFIEQRIEIVFNDACFLFGKSLMVEPIVGSDRARVSVGSKPSSEGNDGVVFLSLGLAQSIGSAVEADTSLPKNRSKGDKETPNLRNGAHVLK